MRGSAYSLFSLLRYSGCRDNAFSDSSSLERILQAEAKSKKNCYGIMQIQWPGTAKDLGFHKRSDLLIPCKSIDAGGRYLRMLLDRYQDDIHLALAAYNYGIGMIQKGAVTIPDGAVWYSRYIYNHLQSILADASDSAGQYSDISKKRIIVFNDPNRAENFLKLLARKIPGSHFDWFRMGLGRFQIVLCYRTEKELQQGKNSLRKQLGFSL